MEQRFARRGVLLPCVVATALFAAAWATGCGGGGNDVNLEVRAPERERADVNPAAQAGGVKIPGGGEFNFQSFRKQAWGPEGTGHCYSKPVGENGAICHAEALNGTGAWSEFQFGYAFDNTAGAAVDGVVHLRLKMRSASVNEPGKGGGAAKAPAQAGDGPSEATASGALAFFIKDSNGLLIRREDLLSTNLAKGPSKNEQARELDFDVRFESNTGYYLVVAGRADVQSVAGGRSSIEIEILDVSMEINWRPSSGASARSAEPNGERAAAASP